MYEKMSGKGASASEAHQLGDLDMLRVDWDNAPEGSGLEAHLPSIAMPVEWSMRSMKGRHAYGLFGDTRGPAHFGHRQLPQLSCQNGRPPASSVPPPRSVTFRA